MKNRGINIWKWLFFLLAGVILACMLLLFFMITSSGDEKQQEPTTEKSGEFQEYFTVQFDTEQLNQLLNEEIDSDEVEVQFQGETASLSAGIHFLGQTIDAAMDFETSVRENGNLLLSQKSVSIGRLSIPGPQALALLQSQADLPEAVEVYPAEQQIEIRLDTMKVGSGYSLRVETFRPNRDDIVFNVGK